MTTGSRPRHELHSAAVALFQVEAWGQRKYGRGGGGKLGGGKDCITVFHQSDAGRAIGIILDALHNARTSACRVGKVYDAVLSLMTRSPVPGGDAAPVVASPAAVLPHCQGLVGAPFPQPLPTGDDPAPEPYTVHDPYQHGLTTMRIANSC